MTFEYKKILLLAGIVISSSSYADFVFAEDKAEDTKKVEQKKTDKKSEIKKEKKKKDSKIELGKMKVKPSDKASMEAGNMFYDVNTKVLTATKNVDIKYQDKELKAEKIVYDRNSKMISAETGVDFKSAAGTNFKASELVTNDTFTKGVLKDVDGKLSDGSTLKSEKVKIVGDKKYQLYNSFYSPCKPCFNKYLWRVRSDKIVYDEDDGRVYYRDAYMDILNVPVGYTPYLSHPTPFAKSKSGFLTPSFGRSSVYGNFLEVPYYYQPQQNLDFTFRPRYMSYDGAMLQTQMRHLLYDGYYQLDVSGTYPEEMDVNGKVIPGADRKFRGHVFGFGNYNFKDDWSFAFDAKRSTDDTYLRRYNINFEDWLTSEARLERIKNRNYFITKGLAFQGLRANDDPDQSPYILPSIEAGRTYLLDGKYNQKINVDLNGLVLKRSEGQQSNRAIGKVAWNATHNDMSGQVFNLDISSRLDAYNVDEVTQLNGQKYQGSFARFIPEAVLSWEYPFINQFNKYNFIVSPVAMAIASPNGNNDSRVANEDSQSIELQDYNLFQHNHISGLDVVESGTRFNYGLRSVVSGSKLGDIGVLFGQNYRISEDDEVLLPGSGMDDNFSDYVGRLNLYNNKNIFTTYRFRLDKDDFKFKRNEAGVTLNFQPVVLDVGYTFLDANATNSSDRQEAYGSTSYAVTPQWSVVTRARRNMDNDANAGWVNVGGGVSYTHDCITTILEVNRDLTRDRDIEPGTEILFKVNFANLGS